MVTQEKLYTIDDLWAMPDDGKRYELIHGEIVEVAGSGGLQTMVAGRILRYLGNFTDEHELGFVSGADGVYELDINIGRIPDVGFISKARLSPPIPEKFIPMPPDLAVEVVSPGDRAMDVRDKVRMYLHYGVRMVWVIYPDLEQADIFTNDGGFKTVDKDGALDGGAVVPGFSLLMAQIFKGLK